MAAELPRTSGAQWRGIYLVFRFFLPFFLGSGKGRREDAFAQYKEIVEGIYEDTEVKYNLETYGIKIHNKGYEYKNNIQFDSCDSTKT